MTRTMTRILLALGLSAALATGVTAPASAHAGTPGVESASGDFTAAVDFGSLTLEPVGKQRCELTVNGTLTFTGTLTGAAQGTTTALVLAPCDEVASTPPGTYFDVFAFTGTFAGTVDGVPVEGDLTYRGVTRAGGQIDAIILLHGSERAVLHADATVAVGGSYRGIVTT